MQAFVDQPIYQRAAQRQFLFAHIDTNKVNLLDKTTPQFFQFSQLVNPSMFI